MLFAHGLINVSPSSWYFHNKNMNFQGPYTQSPYVVYKETNGKCLRQIKHDLDNEREWNAVTGEDKHSLV